jgi:penicillin-binding protein 1A
MNGVTGGTMPALIWEDFMAAAHEGKPLSPLPTLDELDRPNNNTIASFYESLADMFAAAGGVNLAALPRERKLAVAAPVLPVAAPSAKVVTGR